MAISAYVGVPGSGKSYEVVASVIVPALASGRRVVSNISGLNKEKIFAFIKKNYPKSDLTGLLITCKDEDCLKDDFFPYKGSLDTFCKAGDLICIDEVWRIWGSDKDIPSNHRSFIAEHRHFSDEITGSTCDLVVINQAVSNLPRFVKDRVETTYKMAKLKNLGLHSRYKVEVFTGTKLFKTNLTRRFTQKYNKEVFPLYKSYDGDGRELIVDKRQNIFSSKKLWFFALVAIIGMFVSISGVYSFFHSTNHPENNVNETKTNNNRVFIPPRSIEKPPLSKRWRFTGVIKNKINAYAILKDKDLNVRLEPLSLFTGTGSLTSGVVDGEIVNSYSGSN